MAEIGDIEQHPDALNPEAAEQLVDVVGTFLTGAIQCI
jgi:hypothetical protein